jgi:hypothetical protein
MDDERQQSIAGSLGAYGRFGLMGPAMSKYREHLKTALWHSRECGKAIQRACASLGVDPDEPLQESGLVPAPPDGDYSGPDHVEPTAPLDDELENPQSRHRAALRLVRAFASYR